MILTPGSSVTTLLCRLAGGVPLTDCERKVLAFHDLTQDICPSRPPKLSVFGLAVAAELAEGRTVAIPTPHFGVEASECQ